MKKHCVRILSVFFGLAALAITAKAQVPDQLVVKIPYEFVVAGKTLPAGTYKVFRVSDRDVRELVISSFENRAGALVLPVEVADKKGSDQVRVTFQHVGDQRFLSKIETAEHVFTIPVSRSTAVDTLAKANSNPSGQASGGSGSN